jgi:hypothetical protein
MAKKKKNRKTRKQKLARANQQNARSNKRLEALEDNQSTSIDQENNSIASKSVSSKDTATNTTTNSLDYVKKDIRSSLLLASIIVGVFVLIYILLAKTGFGTQVYSIIKL